MSNLTKSNAQSILSPEGNSLAVFLDSEGDLTLKDVRGVTKPLSNYAGGSNPFQYGAGLGSIKPILGTNNSTGRYSSIGGGQCNISSGCNSSISGGNTNCSIGTSSFIGGGVDNRSRGANSVVGGGCSNSSYNNFSVIGGGRCNTASGTYSSILGGQCNNANNCTNVHILGSNLVATQPNTTFMNCSSIENLTAGCSVVVGSNKVLQNAPFTPNHGLFAQTTDSTPVTATAVESSLIGTGVGTLSVPANAFAIGDSFNALLDGTISAVGTATLEIRVKTLTGVLLMDTGVISMDASTLKSWKLDLQFTIRQIGTTGVASISSGGLFSYIKNSGINFEGYVLSTINNTTFDTTISNTLVVTAQWNTNNAGNSIFSRNFVLNKIY